MTHLRPNKPAGRGQPGLAAKALLEKASSRSLDVDAARLSELLHGFDLRAGDVHSVAAVNDALGEEQIRIARHIGAADFALVQGTQNLLGSDYSSVYIGETIMHN